jgi:hypothetical protein
MFFFCLWCLCLERSTKYIYVFHRVPLDTAAVATAALIGGDSCVARETVTLHVDAPFKDEHVKDELHPALFHFPA